MLRAVANPAAGGQPGSFTDLTVTGNTNLVKTLAQSGVGINAPANTSENELVGVTVPAGAMGPQGHLRITTRWSFTNNANNKTMRVRFGGPAGSVLGSVTLTTQRVLTLIVDIWNRNDAASQITGSIFATSGNVAGDGTGAPTPSAVNTAVASVISITGAKDDAGDTLTLDAYTVELMYGA